LRKLERKLIEKTKSNQKKSSQLKKLSQTDLNRFLSKKQTEPKPVDLNQF